MSALHLRKTGMPASLVYNGTALAAYWFEHDGEVFGVGRAAMTSKCWEVVHADTMGTVRDDWRTLHEVRRDALEECERFLRDHRADQEEVTDA